MYLYVDSDFGTGEESCFLDSTGLKSPHNLTWSMHKRSNLDGVDVVIIDLMETCQATSNHRRQLDLLSLGTNFFEKERMTVFAQSIHNFPLGSTEGWIYILHHASDTNMS